MLLYKIERFLTATGIPPARLGREALNDPSFVSDLRAGREPRAETASRVVTYLETWQPPRSRRGGSAGSNRCCPQCGASLRRGALDSTLASSAEADHG